MDIVDRIQELCNKCGITKTELERRCGMSQNSINKWRRSTPNSITLESVARELNTTATYLLGLPDNLSPEEVVIFPVIGMIAAGYDGNVSFDPTGDEIPVPEYLLKTHNPNDYFVLQVIGNSMLPTYHNGDKVLIRKTDSVDSGTIAAVGFDTENATLKKVEYVKGEDWMRLIPLNPDFPIKEIKGTDLNLCRVYGEVVYKFDNRNNATNSTVFSNKFNSLTDEQQQTIMLLMNSMLDKK